MSVISIIGTSGVGKSFLVKQLSSFNNFPAFFEGEDGVIPKEILANIATEESPVKRWEWFFHKYTTILQRARVISKTLDINCYLDVSIIAAEAIISFEQLKYRAILQQMIDNNRDVDADYFILLTDGEKLRERIMNRGRETEQREIIFQRAETIQNAYKALAEKNKRILTINRTDLDFSDEETLKYTNNLINNFIKTVI